VNKTRGMSKFMKFNLTLQKIQNLPLPQRKIIFWIIIVFFSSILFSLYFINVKHKLENLSVEKNSEELKLPELKTETEKLPKFGIGEELKGIKNDINEIKKLIEENQKMKNQ